MLSLGSCNETDYHVSLLRTWMCFEVVCNHFLNRNGLLFSIIGKYSVQAAPIFFFLAFYYFANKITLNNEYHFFNRLRRLIVPQVVWSIIYFAFIWGKSWIYLSEKQIPVSSFFWQLFTGHSPYLNPSMWFQVDLIVVTILFYVIFIRSHFFFWHFVCAIGVISFVFQYSGLNYFIFYRFRYELSYPLGRVFEMIPYASAGVVFFKVMQKYKLGYYRNDWMCILILGLHILFFYKNLFPVSKGFLYSGLNHFVVSVSLCCFCLLFPKINFIEKYWNCLKILTRYTLGIYCIHRFVEILLNPLLQHLNISGTLVACLSIYLVSYSLCFIIDKMFPKYAKNIIS